MVIITGVRFAGKVDAVPRIGHVATRFFHIYYVPLIPLGTFLVTREGDTDFAGVPLPLNGKSILVGWLRTFGWLGLIGSPIVAGLGMAGSNFPQTVTGGIGTAVFAALLWFLYCQRFITHASYERAADIARQMGLPPEQRLMLEVAYGRMTADQAERELARHYEATPQTGR